MQQLAFAFLGCSLLLNSLLATADDELILYTEHFPPYNFENKGVVRGINADILNQACLLAKIKCMMQSYPWLRAMELAQKIKVR